MIQETGASSSVLSDKEDALPEGHMTGELLEGSAGEQGFRFGSSKEDAISPDFIDLYLRTEFLLQESASRAKTAASRAGVARALLVRCLVASSERVQVVIDRHELGRLFDKCLEEVTWDVFSSRLQICELLEDAIEYLESELERDEMDPVGVGGGSICWFTTPGADSDVALRTLRQARNRHLVGLAFGPWCCESAVYILGPAAGSIDPELSGNLFRGVPAMTEEEAIGTLIEYIA